jgi:hypothetical protein
MPSWMLLREGVRLSHRGIPNVAGDLDTQVDLVSVCTSGDDESAAFKARRMTFCEASRWAGQVKRSPF